MITPKEYEESLAQITMSTHIEVDKTLFNCVGLAEEAGECLGKIKRAMRGEGFDREGYILELGDTLGYLALACHAEGLSLMSVSAWMEEDKFVNPNGKNVLETTANLYRHCGKVLLLAEEGSSIEIALEQTYLFILDCVQSDLVNGTLQEVMEANLRKLEDRLRRNGHLLGSGDNR